MQLCPPDVPASSGNGIGRACSATARLAVCTRSWRDSSVPAATSADAPAVKSCAVSDLQLLAQMCSSPQRTSCRLLCLTAALLPCWGPSLMRLLPCSLPLFRLVQPCGARRLLSDLAVVRVAVQTLPKVTPQHSLAWSVPCYTTTTAVTC